MEEGEKLHFKKFFVMLISITALLLAQSKEKLYQQTHIDLLDMAITITASSYLQPGSNILIEIETNSEQKNLRAQFNNSEIPILSVNNKLFCIAGVDVRKSSGTYRFILYQKTNSGIKEIFRHSFVIGKSVAPIIDFGKEPKRSKQFLDKYYQERKIYAQIMEKTEPSLLFEQDFSMPLQEITITGTFGDQRTYNDTKNARIHRGIDLKAPTGTEVYAINDGKILMARNFTFEGNFVAIDHGGGIISFSMHLSEFKVKEGDLVKQGQIIGLSGSTGNSNSPHLHFSIKVNKETTDPLEFIEIINKFLK